MCFIYLFLIIHFYIWSSVLIARTPHCAKCICQGFDIVFLFLFLLYSRFSLCGSVVIDKIPEALGHVTRKRQIKVTTKGQSSEVKTLTSDDQGKFCVEVKPGTYILEVRQ